MVVEAWITFYEPLSLNRSRANFMTFFPMTRVQQLGRIKIFFYTNDIGIESARA